MTAQSDGYVWDSIQGANVGVDKYDIIDKLAGEAYEEAIAKMSDAERTIYAARA